MKLSVILLFLFLNFVHNTIASRRHKEKHDPHHKHNSEPNYIVVDYDYDYSENILRKTKHHHHRKLDNTLKMSDKGISQQSRVLGVPILDKVVDGAQAAVTDVVTGILECKSNLLYDLLHRSGNKVEFLLYNLKEPMKGEIFVPDAPNKQSIWNKAENVKILIHGYQEKGNKEDSHPQNIKNDYITTKKPDNIVIVDWKSLSREINYYDSAKNTKVVGELVAEYILNLTIHGYTDSIKKVHLVGFSLGAQTAGVAGYFVIKKSGGKMKLPRITGLDPAGPGFEDTLNEKYRLDKSDAEFVDVIHCDRGKISGGHFGTDLNIGTVDFYPNGSDKQPGCPTPSVFHAIIGGGCSHSYCPKIFQKTVLGIKYIGCPCKDWETFKKGECNCGEKGPLMGESCCPPGTTGILYTHAVI